MNTLSLVVGVLAAIIAGPTDAYTTSNDMHSLVDLDDNTSLVSVHANVEAEKQDNLIKGTVDALLMWDKDHQGIAGNIMMDHEDGTHCVINADPENKVVEFGAGTKKLSMIYEDDGGSKFILTDDAIRNRKGNPRKTQLPIGLVVEMMDEALEIGVLDPDVTTILDCAKDFYAMYDSDDDERGIGDWVGGIVDRLTPDIAGCPVSELASLAIAIGRSLYNTGVSSATQCYREGIRPAITLFTSGNIWRIATEAAGTMATLTSKCSGAGGLVSGIVSRVRNSCLMTRRLEVLETLRITDGTN